MNFDECADPNESGTQFDFVLSPREFDKTKLQGGNRGPEYAKLSCASEHAYGVVHINVHACAHAADDGPAASASEYGQAVPPGGALDDPTTSALKT